MKTVVVESEKLELSAAAERELIEEFRNTRDRDLFGRLIAPYEKRLFAVVLGFVGNSEDALEVSQETLIKAFKSLHKFKGESSFFTWLYRIAHNASCDYMRKNKRFREVMSEYRDVELDKEAHQGERDVLGELLNRELGDKLKDAVAKLDVKHRNVLILREVEGLSYEEIADVVGCSKGTIMSRLFNARRKVQKIIIEQSDEEFSQGWLSMLRNFRSLSNLKEAQDVVPA